MRNFISFLIGLIVLVVGAFHTLTLPPLETAAIEYKIPIATEMPTVQAAKNSLYYKYLPKNVLHRLGLA